jgi:hypothetical protein
MNSRNKGIKLHLAWLDASPGPTSVRSKDIRLMICLVAESTHNAVLMLHYNILKITVKRTLHLFHASC